MFDLSKWYGDCVSPSGDARIVYSARLRWGAVSLGYESTLDKAGTAAPATSSKAAELHWSSTAPGFSERLYDSSEGYIDWRCVHPRASVCSDGLSGLGYREHLHMTVLPWRLPVRELRWGRYLSEGHTIVWIDWQGGHPLSVVYRDGVRVEAAKIADNELRFDDGSALLLDRATTLRDGPLGTTVLSQMPLLSRMAPARMLAVTETKWLSRACYGGEQSWAIHEVVRWP